jgi:hypothetical protein
MSKVASSEQMTDIAEAQLVHVTVEGGKIWVNDEEVCRFRGQIAEGGKIVIEVEGKELYVTPPTVPPSDET